VDLAQTFLSELFAMLGYALLIVCVYKLFRIGTELKEIKELLQKSTRNSSTGGAASSTLTSTLGDSATEYAENLLRAIHAESKDSESEPQKIV